MRYANMRLQCQSLKSCGLISLDAAAVAAASDRDLYGKHHFSVKQVQKYQGLQLSGSSGDDISCL